MALSACVSSTQYSASWPHTGLHRRPQWQSSHVSLLPSTAFCVPIESSTEGPSATARMCFSHTVQRFLPP
eukprot:8319206-Pyramimonas_sp.AAC.1